jgi:hypothetical protein
VAQLLAALLLETALLAGPLLAQLHLAQLHPAQLYLAVRHLDRPLAPYRAGCEATVRRARSGSYGRPADRDRQGSRVSSRAGLGNRQADVRPRVAPHDLHAAPSAGSASQRAGCTAACWSSPSS